MADLAFYNKVRELGITLTKSGKQICPKCSAERKNKTDKCLSVTYGNETLLYCCHHCGWAGAVPYYERKGQKHYTRPEGFKNRENLNPLIEYFKKRGISEDTLKKYNIGYDEEGCIIFPYYKDGVLVNVKKRKNLGNGKKEFTQTKDSEKTFFGIDLVKVYNKDKIEKNPLIIVEGEMDVLALAEQGIYSVSVPQGGSDSKLECLANCSNDFLKSFDWYVIAVDNDSVGNGLKENLINRFPRDKCKIVNWGQYKDANEALIAGEDLHRFIDNARFLQTDGLIDFSDSWEDLYSELFEADKNYYETGWDDFDKLVKLRAGHLMVVTGYPSRGKSTFVDNMLINLSKKYDIKHLVATFETSLGGYYRSLFEMYTQQPFWSVSKGDEGIKQVLNSEAFEFITNHFMMFDNKRLWTIDSICERAEIEVMKHGVKTLVIDPYNRLKNDYKDREDKYIGLILSKLCMLAKKLNILIIFVAHPKKPDGEKMPDMYSVAGSGDWYNMADYGIVVHRDRDALTRKLMDTPQICIAKVKSFYLGNPSGGKITLQYNLQKRILENRGF